MKTARLHRGFTLVELMVSAGLVAIVGGVGYVLLQSGLNLFARSYALNASNELARITLDRMTRDIHEAIERPALVDNTGAKVTLGAVPVSAAGTRFRKYAAGPFRVPGSVNASGTSIPLSLQAGDSMPRVGQFLVIPASVLNGLPQDVYMRISDVSPAAPAISSSPVVMLSARAGSFMNPAAASGTVSPADTAAYLVEEVAYIVATPPAPAPPVPELRFYPQALSVAADGWSAFDNKANYTVMTPNMSANPEPFTMGSGDRALAVNLQVQDDKYSNRLGSAFTKSMSIGVAGEPHKIPYKTLGL